MTIQNFIEEFKQKNIQNTKITPNSVSDYFKKELKIKTYLPFKTKREIVEMVVAQNTEWVDGIKKHDSINAYICFVVAMIGAHTILEFSDNPVEDYDLLAESGLLAQIIAEFKESYDECDILLKMALAMELEDNSINATVARFLDSILKKLDGVGNTLKDVLNDLNLKEMLGLNFNSEDLAALKSLLDRFK